MRVAREPLPVTERAALSVGAAVDYSGLGKSTIYTMLANKKLASIKVGGRRLILRESLDALLSA
jgi:excisionase family DNA binding protein